MRKKYHIKGNKLIIESDPTVEIPIIKILFVKLENDTAGPCVKITTVSGVVVRFWVCPNQKDKILEMIQNKRAEVITGELRKCK
ncbi:MAG: hypothetical protein WCG99_03630 [Candidatus Berkelbacteria bacterium]